MKISDIENFKDIVKLCKYKTCNKIYINDYNKNIFHPFHPTLPQDVLEDDMFLFFKYHNASDSIGYRFLSHTIKLNRREESEMISGIIGILYSYDTPIGLILEKSNILVVSKGEKFKIPNSDRYSSTTSRILNVLNSIYVGIDRKLLKTICKELKIESGEL